MTEAGCLLGGNSVFSVASCGVVTSSVTLGSALDDTFGDPIDKFCQSRVSESARLRLLRSEKGFHRRDAKCAGKN